MKKLFFIMLAIVFGLNVFAQKVTTATSQLSTADESLCSTGPDQHFQIVFRGSWGYREYALVKSIEAISTSTSNIHSINSGAPAVTLNPEAFLNTSPCYTLAYIQVVVCVYNSSGVNVKSATIRLTSIFYYDYPINNSCRYYEYYIPNNAWQLYMVPTIDLETL